MQTNVLYYGNNLTWLRQAHEFPDESVDLIYLDPPFNSKDDYNLIFEEIGEGGEKSVAQVHAFEDSWHWGPDAEEALRYLTTTAEHGGRVPERLSTVIDSLIQGLGKNDLTAYLLMMAVRLVEMRRVLKRTGSLYLHCDPVASHYLKIILDALLGAKNFRREIIWRSGWVSGYKTRAKNWVRNHDVLLYYAKDVASGFTFNKQFIPHPPGYKRRGGGGNPQGTARDDVVTDIYSPWIMSFSQEKLGYRTQKPVALLELIVATSSNPGDVVLDPFCGCGTAIAAAEKLGRKWVGIDITHLAIAVMRSRLRDQFGLVKVPVFGLPVDLAGAEALALEATDGRYQFQSWALSLIGAMPTGDKTKKGADQGIDGAITFTDKEGMKRVLVSVKSGGVGVTHVRDLRGTVAREKAAIGILITLEEPTKPMKDEAVKAGLYHSELWGADYPTLQIITIGELLDEKLPKLPPQAAAAGPKAVRVAKHESEQQPLLPETGADEDVEEDDQG